jgi:metal-sulfur cluster biosynthetic enzyme
MRLVKLLVLVLLVLNFVRFLVAIVLMMLQRLTPTAILIITLLLAHQLAITQVSSTSTSSSTVDQNVIATNTNNNINENLNVSESVSESSVNTVNENINRNETDQRVTQYVYSPPPSAIAPSIGSSYSQDLCTTGVSGAISTQLFGMSNGRSVTDANCERIKLSKTLFDMGMKVASVSLMCQDERVFVAMEMAGTPCPYEGMIGVEAQSSWEANPERRPDYVEYTERQKVLFIEQCMLEESERQCIRNWQLQL